MSHANQTSGFNRITHTLAPNALETRKTAAELDQERHNVPRLYGCHQSLLNSGSCDPLLQGREVSEHLYLHEIVEKQAKRTAWLPWQADEPIGPDALAHLASSNLQPMLG